MPNGFHRVRRSGHHRNAQVRAEPLEPRWLMAADVVISEFMADNTGTLADSDGAFSDWIELTNTSANPVDLAGWHLTDNANNLNKWTFPTTNLAPGAQLVVFASGKDRAVSGSQLHTSFSLSAEGEFLGLVRPDGVTIESSFGPTYPQQLPNVSYGLATSVTTTTLVASGAAGRTRVPANAGEMPAGWNTVGFDDSAWTAGSSAVGYDTGAPDSSYPGVIAADAPIHYWRMEQTAVAQAATDQGSTPTNNGTYRGNILLGQQSASTGLGTSAHFDGVEGNNGTFVDMGLFHPGNNVSIEAWVKADSFPKAFNAIASRWDGSYELDVNAGSGKANFVVRNNTNQFALVESATTITANAWHHLVGIFANGTATIYLDGVQGTSVALGGALQNAGPNRVLIGATREPAAFNWTGYIDEVAVYNRGLTTAEIQNHFNAATNGGAGVDFHPYFQTDLAAAMLNLNSTVLQRIPFNVSGANSLNQLTLSMKYDDGFVAYLNGQEVARRNAPGAVGQPLGFSSAATSAHADASAVVSEDIDLTQFLNLLQSGPNVLAIQGLNVTANNPDFLLVPQLTAKSVTVLGAPPLARYFVTPTPNAPNGTGAADRGPILSQVAHTPAIPADNDNLVVTARVVAAAQALAPGSVTLHARVMFGAEFTLPMLDDGVGSDLVAGDGIYTGVIPASVSIPGQMVRYYVTAADNSANTSRWPLYADANGSEQYQGTVVANPGVTSALPILQWFVQNTAAADTVAGTRASLFYNGEFYDNVFARVRGATAPLYPKKPYKFDFNRGHYFSYDATRDRVSEINLNTTYQDKAYVRAPLSMEIYNEAETPAPDAFNVRVQQNGLFYSVAVMVEQINGTFLSQRDLDPNGAMYKIFNGLESTAGAEKKTRESEPYDDLQALVNGVNPTNPNRSNYLRDNLDLPAVINYLAAGAIFQDFDRTVKNYYMYRDTNGDGLWQIFPWDKDLTFGLRGLTSDTVSGNVDAPDWISHPLFGTAARNCCGTNQLFDALFADPTLKDMYLRRLRTLMDEFLQAPGTPADQLKIEKRLDELAPILQPDATLDLNKWGAGYGSVQNLTTAMNAIKTGYLATRRTHLYNKHSIDNVANYAQAAGIPHAQPNIAALPAASRGITFGSGAGQLDVSPVSGNQDEEYLTLLNSNPFAVDISGWKLSGGVEMTFAPGTVIPANGTLYVSPNSVAFRARATGPHGNQGLLVVGAYGGHLSTFGETIDLADNAAQPVASLTYPGDPSAIQQYLRISEIMYNPAPSPPTDNNAFEFLELTNIGPDTLNLQGVHFSQGVVFTFGNVSLAPGGFVLAVKNRVAFESRYGLGLNIAGEFTSGSLDNGGDHLKLEDAGNDTILEFSYDDAWYPSTDGPGHSLVIVDPLSSTATLGNQASWRPSHLIGGSPGLTDPAPTTVAARRVFYNNSQFDGRNSSANSADDSAIASDKSALLPGAVATFANYTSYNRGLNGVMIDLNHLVGIPTAADFEFHVGNDDSPNAWIGGPAPSSVSVRALGGPNDTSRVTLVWPDGAIRGQWLQITVKNSDAIGLVAPDVFYFGNAIGDTGDSPTNATVDANDEIGARGNLRSFLSPAAVDNVYDFNRDGLVNAADQIAARGAVTDFSTDLNLISLVAPPPLAPPQLRMTRLAEDHFAAALWRAVADDSDAMVADTAFTSAPTMSTANASGLESQAVAQALTSLTPTSGSLPRRAARRGAGLWDQVEGLGSL